MCLANICSGDWVEFTLWKNDNMDAHTLFTTTCYQSCHRRKTPVMLAVFYRLTPTLPDCTDMRGAVPSMVTSVKFWASYAFKGRDAGFKYVKMQDCHTKITNNNGILPWHQQMRGTCFLLWRKDHCALLPHYPKKNQDIVHLGVKAQTER